MTDQEKVLDRLKKLKAMADSAATIGSEEEAQAFASMMQKMMLDHKLEMSDLEFEQFEKEQPVINVGVDDVIGKKERVLWSEKLAGIIARAHFCRITVYSGSSKLGLIGREQDVAVCKVMIVAMQQAAYRLAKTAAYQQKLRLSRNDEPAWKNKGFKFAFLDAFIQRLSERYEDLRRASTVASTAMVRVNTAEKAVKDFIASKDWKQAKTLTNKVHHNSEGYHSGREAANRVNLKADGLGGQTVSGNKLIQ